MNVVPAFLLLSCFVGQLPPAIRTIHVQSGADADCAVTERLVNGAMSRRTHHVPLFRADKNTLILNLADLARSEKDYIELLTFWEQFAIDEPYYLGAATIVEQAGRRVIIRANAPHLDPRLFKIQNTNVPKVESRWFNKKIYTTLEGGLYYQFRGVPDTLEEFLTKFGETSLAKMQGDAANKSAILFSRVTGKPRAVLISHSGGGKTSLNQGLVMLTQDIKDTNGDAFSDPIRTLLRNKPDAFEVIAELPNGEHVFALFNGQGKRQDSVPDDIAHDHTVKEPFTAKLQPGISCARCHGPLDGIQHVGNDVLALKLALVGDVGDPIEDIDTLTGLFSGDFSEEFQPFMRARDDYARQMVYTGSRYGIVDVQLLHRQLATSYSQYAYNLVNGDTAVQEIRSITGYKIPFGATMDDILVSNPPDKDFFGKEDPYVRALRLNLKITRSKFEQIFAPLVSRVKEEVKE